MAQSTIIATATAGQWRACFEGSRPYAFHSENPLKAVRLLLERTRTEPAVFLLVCDQAGSEPLKCSVTWDPPELLLPCQACEGRGEYIGLFEREVCVGCRGRGVVPV